MIAERPRILFVDDEQNVLDGLAGSLWRWRKSWNMTFVCGGRAAIDALSATRFDVVVSDMRMPVVDGEAVLVAAAKLHPGTLRLILSGQTERTVVARATSVAHQFLSKPCGPDELRECVERLLVIVRPMADSLRDVVCAVRRLPIAPRALAHLQALVEAPDVDRGEVVACIESDIGLGAKLLHVASGGFFAKRQAVTSVPAAVRILGIDAVRMFALALASCESTAQMDQFSARVIDLEHVHALGELALLHRFGDEYAALLAEATNRGDLHAMEVARFATSHDEVGVGLVDLWGLPRAIVGTGSSFRW